MSSNPRSSGDGRSSMLERDVSIRMTSIARMRLPLGFRFGIHPNNEDASTTCFMALGLLPMPKSGQHGGRTQKNRAEKNILCTRATRRVDRKLRSTPDVGVTVLPDRKIWRLRGKPVNRVYRGIPALPPQLSAVSLLPIDVTDARFSRREDWK